MKKSMKASVAFLLVMAFLLIVGAGFLVRYVVLGEKKDKTGWSTKAGATYYLNEEGKPLQGWQEIDGNRYYFLPDSGIRVDGWTQIDNDSYYFGDDGIVRTGWQEIDGRKYYLGDSGKLTVGLCRIDGKSYYFDTTGVMGTGWQNANGVPYYFSETGEAMPGWQQIEGSRYYFKETGEALVGLHTLDDKLFYFAETGKSMSGWQTVAGKQYYFTEAGAVTGVQTIDGVVCRFEEDGAAKTGWYEENGSKYYLAEKGTPAIGKHKVGGNWYYFDSDGKMATGWINANGETHYCQKNGVMVVGQLTLEGIHYFFTSTGNQVLLVNKDNPVPKSYKLDLVEYEGFEIDSSAKEALEKMRKDCPYETTIDNIYRSEELQKIVWNSGVSDRMLQGMSYEEAVEATARRVMTPGHSEHQTGLAVDLLGDEEGRKWLEEHCWEYGFIVRYPEGKYEFTGIDYEYWHFRYVGIELSLELKELGLCLEEYMQSLTK